VRELSVGLLCPEEPFPPETPQPFAAYQSVLRYIRYEYYGKETWEDLPAEHDRLKRSGTSAVSNRTRAVEEMDQWEDSEYTACDPKDGVKEKAAAEDEGSTKFLAQAGNSFSTDKHHTILNACFHGSPCILAASASAHRGRAI